MVIASLVLGIISLVFMFIPGVNFLGILTAIAGIILGVLARKSDTEKKGMATAGLVCSIIALALVLIVLIACASCVGCTGCLAASSYM